MKAELVCFADLLRLACGTLANGQHHDITICNLLTISAHAGILAVEAYHGGIIRTQLYNSRDANTPYNVTVAEVISAISNLRDTADGQGESDEGIVTTRNGVETANLVPTNNNGLVFTRDPQQVLDIVTLGQGANGGGFFPEGLNGFFGPQGDSASS